MPEITGTPTKKDVEKAEAVGSSDSVKPSSNGVSENGVSSTSPEKDSPEKNEAEVLLAQGKRHLFIKDFPNAVAVLGDACAKFSEMFGDLADECAEAYFNYGRALLELAREESNVLGADPDKDNSSEEGDEEGEEEGEEDEVKSAENGEAEAKNGDEKSEENSKKGNKTEDNKESQADETIDTTREINEGEDKSEEGKEEDVDNLQLAWEVFELAKNIYERQESKAKLAQTYLYLGEVGLESENYSSAIDDMKKCVEIQKQILPPHHRDIAETYFQLGIACSLCNEFDNAITNFKTSSEILETRIKTLEENGAPETDVENNPFYSVEKEISEIKSLLPEIKAKIVDMEDFKQETIKSVMVSLSGSQKSDGAGPSSSTSSSAVSVANGSEPKPVTNISHLVRKKRKPEEEVTSEPVVKKSCTEEVSK